MSTLVDKKPNFMLGDLNHEALEQHVKRIVLCLYLVLIFFISFDGLRDSTIFYGMLSYIREGTVLLLFILSLGPRARLRKNAMSLGLIALVVCYLYGLLLTLFPYFQHLRSISDPVIVLYRHAQFLMLILVFSQCRRLSGKGPKYYLGVLVVFQMIYTIITPLIYYFPPSIMREGYDWWGRLGIGYPTMDAQVFCFALVAVVCCFNLSMLRMNFVVSLLVIGALMQVTGTGLATLMFLLVYMLVCEREKMKRLLPSIFVVVVLLATTVFIYYELLEKPLQLAMQKLTEIASLGSGISTDIRREQLEQLLHLGAGDPFRWLFGLGANVYVENQYSFFLAAFGVIGFCMFLFFLVTAFVQGMRNAGKDNRALVISVVVFSLSSYTLVTFYLFPTYAVLALFIAYSLSQNRNLKAGASDAG